MMFSASGARVRRPAPAAFSVIAGASLLLFATAVVLILVASLAALLLAAPFFAILLALAPSRHLFLVGLSKHNGRFCIQLGGRRRAHGR